MALFLEPFKALLLGPFIHAQFAFNTEFLAFLDKLAEIFSAFVPNLQIEKSGYLLFLSPSVRVILVVCQ